MDGLIAYILAKKYTDEHGGGGPGSGYTKRETDALLRKKQDVLINKPAEVGQVAIITEVNSNGLPVKWEPGYAVLFATDEDILELLSDFMNIKFASAPDGSVYTDLDDNIFLV